MAFMISKTILISCHASIEPKKKFSSQFLKPNFSNSIVYFNSVNYTKRWDINHLACASRKQSKNQTLEYDDEWNIKRQRNKLRAIGDENPFESLVMIDTIQRLGINHLFRHEIEEILRTLYRDCSLYGYYGRNLHDVSLCFDCSDKRGTPFHKVGIFNNFKDKDGEFEEELKKDTDGLVELFEASHLSIEGEEILDQARDFAINHLRELSSTQENYKARAMLELLINQPHHKSFSRLMAKKFTNTSLTGDKEWIRGLQEVAKVDFKVVQAMHQKEVSQTFRWWRELGLDVKLTKARNQPLEWYTWSMGIFEDPNLSEQRLDFTKSISFIYLIDDIFDVYGGINELTIFTEFVNRWDNEGLEKLPRHMKICFERLDKITMEISQKVYRLHGWNPIKSLQRSWGILCKAFLVEAKWFESDYLPDAEEYLKNGIVSSGVHVMMLHVFLLMGQEITKEEVEFICNNPRIVSSTATIFRLWNDLDTSKDENQDGHDGSYIECYMKEHQGSTMAEARKHVSQKISDAWKCLNKECLFPEPLSRSFSEACLNLARMVSLMHSYDDSHNRRDFNEYLKSLMEEV